MTDLVKRLRELNTFEWHARPATTKEACFAAADRIEKLEAALRQIKDLLHGPEDDDVLHIRDDMTYKIVCDALEEIDGK